MQVLGGCVFRVQSPISFIELTYLGVDKTYQNLVRYSSAIIIIVIGSGSQVDEFT